MFKKYFTGPLGRSFFELAVNVYQMHIILAQVVKQ